MDEFGKEIPPWAYIDNVSTIFSELKNISLLFWHEIRLGLQSRLTTLAVQSSVKTHVNKYHLFFIFQLQLKFNIILY